MPDPIPVDRALAIVLEAAPVLPATTAPLDDCAGRILAEDVCAPEDAPPFDKALMDGFAVVAADLDRPPAILPVVATLPAGSDPRRAAPLTRGTAARIMTGAPMPPGADAVIVVEATESVPGPAPRVRCARSVRPGDNLARAGADLRRGAVVVATGDFLGAGEIGALAACGRTVARVGGRPRAAVLATGDELVPAGDAPGPGRIRNSNGPALCALARRAGASARDLGIARDDRAALSAALAAGLEEDLLIVSGGVSMGEYDLVADALRDLGVTILFDRVAIRPGRPFTFGRRGRTLVCACPGNPASSYVAFQVFVRPAIRRMMGHPVPGGPAVRGVLAAPVRQRPGRTAYLQAQAGFASGRVAVEAVPTTGSADFAACARGNALIIVPADVASLPEGSVVDVLLLDDHLDR